MNGIAAGSATSGHTVLAEAEGGAYQSLRQRPVTRAERYALGDVAGRGESRDGQ